MTPPRRLGATPMAANAVAAFVAACEVVEIGCIRSVAPVRKRETYVLDSACGAVGTGLPLAVDDDEF